MDQYGILVTISIICISLISITGLVFLFKRLSAMNQGIGPLTLKTIGILSIIPPLVILVLLKNEIRPEVAALFGTIAGYVLSKEKE